MEIIAYNKETIDLIQSKIQALIKIVSELEDSFPNRHFTLDGHLVGSIGEVLAAYYYGIDLYTASTEVHDGIIHDREVQIKITQQDSIQISAEPDYLIVLYLTKKGRVFEVYNGPGKEPWDSASKMDSHNNRHMKVNKLMELDTRVPSENRITALQHIEKMKKEFKNRKKLTGKPMADCPPASSLV